MMSVKLLVVPVTILLFGGITMAQKQAKVRREANSRHKIDALIDSAESALSKSPTLAYDYMTQALELSMSTKNKEGEGRSYYKLGKINFHEGQYDASIENYRRGIDIFFRMHDEAMVLLGYLKTADAHKASGANKKALLFYNKFLEEKPVTTSSEKKEAEKSKLSSTKKNNRQIARNDDNILAAKTAIADIYFLENELGKARQMYSEVLEAERARDNKEGIITATNRIADISLKEDDTEDALDLYNESQKTAIEIDDDIAISQAYKNLGKVYRQQKDFDREIDLRRESIEHNVASANSQALSEDNYEIGNALIEQDKLGEAIGYLEQSLQISEEISDVEQKGRVLKSLSAAYDKMGDFSKAYEVYREYAATIDSINKQKERQLVAYIQQSTTLNKKQQQIDILEKDIEISEKRFELLHQQQQVRSIILYALLVVVASLIVTSLLILRSSRQKKKANQLLALRSLQSQMNPHFIFNALNSVNSYISKNDEKSANKFLADFSKLMRLVMDNSSHNFITLLNEINIIDLYLKLEHHRFKDQFDCAFLVDEKLKTESYELPPMLIQPYIENAVWHGLRYKKEKGLLTVEISKSARHLQVTVEDDGIGRDKSQALKTKNQKSTKSMALKNIDLRRQILKELYKIDIQVQIDDLNENEQTGTRVRLSIPLISGQPE
jgi:two-component system LytT family sensor kinase